MDKLLADDALDALGVIQNELPYGIAGTIGYALAKLKEYEQAEQEGVLVKLPCKVGDKLYVLGCPNNPIEEWEMILPAVGYKDSPEGVINEIPLGIFQNSLGKIIFLTKQDAEKALEKGGRIDDHQA